MESGGVTCVHLCHELLGARQAGRRCIWSDGPIVKILMYLPAGTEHATALSILHSFRTYTSARKRGRNSLDCLQAKPSNEEGLGDCVNSDRRHARPSAQSCSPVQQNFLRLHAARLDLSYRVTTQLEGSNHRPESALNKPWLASLSFCRLVMTLTPKLC